jgi:hypothetical protein
MQARDVIIPARRELQDDQKARFADMVLFGFLADGIADLLRVRPDLMLAEDGSFGDGGGFAGGSSGAGFVRIRNGRLEVWDDGLHAFVAVSFRNGALVPMISDDPAPADDFVSADGLALSLDTEIPIDDRSLITALVDYVVYRGKKQYAASADEMKAAAMTYASFLAKLGVRRGQQ